MSGVERWLLPDGVEEALPVRAHRLEVLRRRLLDLYSTWGYELVMPPLVEFLDSLLCGAGEDIRLQTFRLTDQLSGRALGVRADITPQVARIDAHSLPDAGTRRLCYAGSVLHARPSGLSASRAPLQAGAELFGSPDPAADIEIVSLMLETLALTGRRDVHLDLGHVAIHRRLVAGCGLDADREQQLFDVFQRKSVPELDAFLAAEVRDETARRHLRALVGLAGDANVLGRASRILAGTGIEPALVELARLGEAVRGRYPHIEVGFDLCEVRGWRYHSGCVFAAYVAGRSREVAKGGRYDGIGALFGRERPATGFSVDIKTLADIAIVEIAGPAGGILAPAVDDPALAALVAARRAAGERVVYELPGAKADPAPPGCDRVFVHGPAGWEIVPR